MGDKPAFALDGGTPAEIAAERQRAALAARRAELEAQAAAPGPDLGTVSVQEGLPGIGGDGTLFTPPPGGWGAAPRAPSSGALADAGAASPSMIEEAMAESARGGWGDESRVVQVVGGAEPAWRPEPGKSASEMKAELKTAAERDIQAQPNRFYDPERRVHGLIVDGVRHYLNPSGMMHGIVGRRGAANGAAVARIGTVLNASVAVPGVPGDQAFRIAPVNFGAPGHALFVFDTVGGENKLADILVLHSLNVKAGTAARPRLATDGSRPTTETLAQLREAWQVDFLPGLKERARQKAAARGGALADAAPEPAVRPSSGSVAAVRRAHPDWDPRRAAEFAARYIGPALATGVGLATGYDLNMGREIAGEREAHPIFRRGAWAWDNLTGRGLGLLSSGTVEKWIWGDGPDANESARRASGIPMLDALPGFAIRKSGGGEWEARRMAQSVLDDADREARRLADTAATADRRMRERAERGIADARADASDQTTIDRAAARIGELGYDPRTRLENAAARAEARESGLTPSQRLVIEKRGKLPEKAIKLLDPYGRAMLESPEYLPPDERPPRVPADAR